ncbi:contractile injection system tape measure protein [Roseateles sp. P5_D6]
MHDWDRPTPHIVEGLTLDNGFGGGITPHEAELRLAACAQGPLLRVIDEVFDACCPPDEHWRLDELAIDLGELPLDDWEAEAPRRLRERLQRLLADLRATGDGAGAAGRATGLQVRTRPQARRESLLYFLRHGRLPWQARGDDLQALAAAVLAEDAAGLVAALRAMPDRATLLQRLATQFGDALLAALVRAFMPGEPAAATRLLEALAPARRAGLSPRARSAWWASVLGQALDHASAPRPALLMLLRAQLLAALDGATASSAEGDPLQSVAHAWVPLLREDRDWLRTTLERAAETPAVRERLAQLLPLALLPRLLGLWMAEPAGQAVTAWIGTVAAGDTDYGEATTTARQRRLWQATLAHTLRHKAQTFDVARYEAQVREDLLRQTATATAADPPSGWFDRVVRRASAVLAAAVSGLRLPWRARALPSAATPPGHVPSAAPPAAAADAPTEPVLESLAVANAGLVLLSPYLPRLFEHLGLLAQGASPAAFVGPESAARAALLLQALATGEAAAPEPALVLNKLLCGLALDAPLPCEIVLSTAEREALDGLLGAVIQHWRILGTTSLGGLRDTFLRRAAQLELRDEAWRLAVEPGPFDMLIDQLPWGYSTLRHSWMERVIHVDWR